MSRACWRRFRRSARRCSRSLSSSLNGSSLSDSSVQERLRRAGSSQSVSAFRAEQLLWALAGVTVMSALTVIGVVQAAFLHPGGSCAGARERFKRLSGA